MNHYSFGALFACLTFFTCDVASAAAGRTNASFGVSQTGASQYSIPLFAPPGTAGMTPALALTYSSNAGDGLAGAGFQLAGLSQIARCNRTVEQDGAASPPKLATTDRLCLDGVQLRVVTGTNGIAGSTYATEVETFTRITAYGAAGSGPAYFIAEQKNGLIYEYGNSSDSRIESLGVTGNQVTTARAWALSRIRDRSGNSIDFTYVEDTTYGSFRPNEIRWTSNPAQGLAAAYRISFVYESAPRPDTLYSYGFGDQLRINGSVIETKRLDRIDVSYNTTLVRRYELTYDSAGGAGSRSRLQSVQECGLGGSDCFPPTVFSWINGTSGWNVEASTGQAIPAQPLVMDINNDGRDDLVYSSSATAGSGYWLYMLGNANGGYNSPVATSHVNHGLLQAMPLDWDGDGQTDFIAPNASAQWVVFRANGSGFDPVNTGIPTAADVGRQWWTADVDGDGRSDLVYTVPAASTIEIYARLSTGTGFAPDALLTNIDFGAGGVMLRPNAFGDVGMRMRSSTQRADFDGDGREDFVIFVSHAAEPDYPNPPAITNYLCMVKPGFGPSCVDVSMGSAARPQTWLVGDLTGDGLSDLFYIINNSAYAVQSNGNGWRRTTASIPFPTATYPPALARIADWDGDGRDDLIAPNASGELFVARSTGALLKTLTSTGSNSGTGTFAAVGDVNGDGLPDLLRQGSSAWAVATHRGVVADLLGRATDSYGNLVKFDYASIAQSHHTRASGAVYPERDDQTPRYVVSQHTASDGVGSTYTVSHWYYGARAHVKGRGFEGFQAHRALDSRNGLYTYEFYRQRFPMTGLLEKRESYQPNGSTLISRLENSWQTHAYGSGPESRALPYVSSSRLTKHEVGGTHNGALLATATTTNLVDAPTGTLYDSSTVVTEASTANGIAAGQSFTQRTLHSSLFTDLASWCIGQPSSTQRTSSHTMHGGAAVTRTLSASWDAAKCRPTSQVLQPGDPAWQVSTILDYDPFGNVSAQTITGIGLRARTTTVNWGATGQFPRTLTNTLSQQTSLEWNAALGVQTAQTDANGLTVSWRHDSFARRTREVRPDGTGTSWSYLDCASLGCINPNNRTVILAASLDTNGNAIRNQYTYHDSFDRLLLTRAQTLSGAYSRAERTYDALGRLMREGAPCWWDACTSGTSFWTLYTYDALNRLTQISRPINDGSGYGCGASDPVPPCYQARAYYEGFSTRTVDAEGKETTQVATALGALRRITDAAGFSITYDYDAFANLARVTDNAAGSTTLQANTYSVTGSRLTSVDADLGSWTYTPNALGEVISQRDANGAVTTFTYDLLGRMTSRAFPNAGGAITSTYIWGTSASAKDVGKLSSQQISGTGISTYRENYAYDPLGRLAQTTYIAGNTNYAISTGYAATTGLLESLTYPLSTASYRLKLRYDYRYGHLAQVSDYGTGKRFWLANAGDPQGHITDETFGDPSDAAALLRTTSAYDMLTGRLDSRQTGPSGGSATQNLTYDWSRTGNLVQRRDANRNLTERFFYDSVNRLDYSALNGATNLDVAYDSRGNIVRKTGVGAYTYSPARPHAVSSINTGSSTLAYTYDANGNMTRRAGSTISWFADNLPRALAVNSTDPTSFQYTPYGQRWQQSYRANGSNEWTTYIGSIFERVTTDTATTFRHYIHANGKPVALYVRNASGSNKLYTLLLDHLGSIDAIHDANGTQRARESFDAFGKRRSANWSGSPSSADLGTIASLTRRGFTQHEHLDSLGLINMNGRIYDPQLARFLSADPVIPDELSGQAFNRYSYIENNPLALVDPSGFQPTCVDYGKACTKPDEPPGVGDRPFWDWRDGGRVSNLGISCYGNCRTSGYFNGSLGVRYEWQRGSRSSVTPLDPANGTATVNETPGRWVNTFGDNLNRAFDAIGEQIGVGLFICIFDSGLAGGGCSGRQMAVQSATYLANVLPAGKLGEAVELARVLPDSALVVRGGGAANQTAARIDAAVGPSRTPGISGFSAQCNGGTCLSELGRFLRNKELGVTTVGEIRQLGGNVVATPGIGSHVTVTGLSGEAASPLMRILKNPNPLVGP